MLQRRFVPFTLVVLAVAACGGPATPTGPATADGEVYSRDASPRIYALALGVADAAAIGPTGAGLGPADFVEIVPDFYVGPFAVVEDGEVTVELPAGADLPAGALVPLAQSVAAIAGCAPTAQPTGAVATYSVFEGVAVPGMIALTNEGATLAVATDVAIPFGTELGDFSGSFYGWTYVDRDARLVSGATCADFDVDLELAEGWNQIAWTITGPGPTLRARIVAPAPFVAFAQLPLGGSGIAE